MDISHAPKPQRNTIDPLLIKAQKNLTDEEVHQMIEEYGDTEASSDFGDGKKVLIALRRRTNSKAHLHGKYDDPMLLTWRSRRNHVLLKRFKGNTEPAGIYAHGQARAAKGSSIDIDGDGRNDLGRLKAGTYHYVKQNRTFLGNKFFRARNIQTAERDVNHDGSFSIIDGDIEDPRGAGRSMLLHRGGRRSTWSAGCQTLSPLSFNRLLGALGDQSNLSYILIDVA